MKYLSLNNPIGIKRGGETFKGQRVPSSHNTYKQFLDVQSGYRAAFITIGKLIAAGCNTPGKIIEKLAPSHQGGTDKYIKFVCKSAKVSKTKQLSLNDGELIISMIAAMSEFENGTPAVVADVEAGFSIQELVCR